jgi:hypothetical protein
VTKTKCETGQVAVCSKCPEGVPLVDLVEVPLPSGGTKSVLGGIGVLLAYVAGFVVWLALTVVLYVVVMTVLPLLNNHQLTEAQGPEGGEVDIVLSACGLGALTAVIAARDWLRSAGSWLHSKFRRLGPSDQSPLTYDQLPAHSPLPAESRLSIYAFLEIKNAVSAIAREQATLDDPDERQDFDDEAYERLLERTYHSREFLVQARNGCRPGHADDERAVLEWALRRYDAEQAQSA